MEGSLLEWFDIQSLEIIYRLYSDGQLLDLVFPRADLKRVEMFVELFEQNKSSFYQATQEILQNQDVLAAGIIAPRVLKAQCRGKLDRKKNLTIQVNQVTFHSPVTNLK